MELAKYLYIPWNRIQQGKKLKSLKYKPEVEKYLNKGGKIN